MKRLILTLIIVLGFGLTTFADPNGGGLFHRGATPEQRGNRDGSDTPLLPGHGTPTNADADQVPVGTGIIVLAVLSGAYLVGKRRKEEY